MYKYVSNNSELNFADSLKLVTKLPSSCKQQGVADFKVFTEKTNQI